MLADKSILESKDFLSGKLITESGNPYIHGMRNHGPHSKWCLAHYNTMDKHFWESSMFWCSIQEVHAETLAMSTFGQIHAS
jgi:hypothetical protein